MPTTKQYEPEQETDYTINYWCWYRSTGSDPWCVPPELFDLLTGGRRHINHRSYETKEEAMADLLRAQGHTVVQYQCLRCDRQTPPAPTNEEAKEKAEAAGWSWGKALLCPHCR
jgi:hypothetical protein